MKATRARSLVQTLTFAALVGISFLARVPLASGDDVQLWTVVTADQRIFDRLQGGIQTRLRVIDDVSVTRDVLLRPFLAWQV